MHDITVRKTIPELCQIKMDLQVAYKEMNELHQKTEDLFKEINGYSFYRLEKQYHQSDEKNIDQRCWRYLIRLYNLERYMLCTEYEKMSSAVEEYNFPVFNEENATGWLASLKSLVYESIQKLIEDVFKRIVSETYFTGTGYSQRVEKKRNNNGIDKHFILRTHDYSGLSWYSSRPTLTDDLEKACYIIEGKELPDITIKALMRREKIWESTNPFFRIRVCQNGNTHYWLNDDIRQKLNYYGAKRGVIGENIRIKVFEK